VVEILPFKALTYNNLKIKHLSQVVSPPYDVISEQQDTLLRSISPYNIINLILPAGSPATDKYLYAATTLNQWIREDILQFESQRCFYLLEESFKTGGQKKRIIGFIGLNKIEEYSTQKVLRHENTLPKAKQDRLNLLESTRANFGLVYTIYRDQTNFIEKIADSCPEQFKFKPSYDPTLEFRLWKLCQPDLIQKIIKLMAAKQVLIADGHHRYETSRIYGQKASQEGWPGQGHEYILTLFVNSYQKDIAIYPTYRLVETEKPLKIEQIIDKISPYFNIKIKTYDGFSIDQFLVDRKNNQIKSFLIYMGNGLTLEADYKNNLLKNDLWQDLDVNILHNVLLDQGLGKSMVKNIHFTHSWQHLKSELDKGKYNMGILLNAPNVSEVETLSRQGYLMPQKSTYFYPKPCTGLVMYKLDSY